MFIKTERAGFSLLEILVGIAIFMVGMIGVAALLVSTVKYNTFSGKMSEATFLAEAKMEELLEKESTDVDLADKQISGNQCFGVSGLGCTGSLADGSTTSVGRNNSFDLYWNVADGIPTAQGKIIKVIAVWKGKGQIREVWLQSIYME